MWGNMWADPTGCRQNGLPPVAYSRHQPMSDRMNALMNNPFFLVDDAAAWQILDILGPSWTVFPTEMDGNGMSSLRLQ